MGNVAIRMLKMWALLCLKIPIVYPLSLWLSSDTYPHRQTLLVSYIVTCDYLRIPPRFTRAQTWPKPLDTLKTASPSGT